MNKPQHSNAEHAALLLDIEHLTHYRYASRVSLAHHLAHLQPLHDAHQQLLAFDLHIDPSPTTTAAPASAPATASRQHFFSLLQAHRHLRVRASSRVRVRPRFTGLQAQASPAWETLAAGLRFGAGRPYQPAVQYTFPSPFVPRLQALRVYAEASFSPGLPVVQGALALMERIYNDFTYDPDSTDIHTPLSKVLTDRRGVCQDFAHLMIGALRTLGLPARYVSGYLLTEPPEGGPALVGADATHAWVQVWCPGTPGVPVASVSTRDTATDTATDTANGAATEITAETTSESTTETTLDTAGWLDLDPTNNRVPGAGHVRLAVGRDFGDVTPLYGVIRGGGQHTLTVGVTTRVLPST